jgi:D,D-heptose 1,7-bisphosphate phosphatase
MAKALGYLLIVITNQSGVARGYLTESDLKMIHERMQQILGTGGVVLDAIYYCPHYPTGRVAAYRKTCPGRKPGTMLGERATEQFDIDVRHSFMVGDKDTDLYFGRALGVRTCLVRTGMGRREEQRLGRDGIGDSMVFDNLLEAVRWISKEGSDRQ